MASLHGPSFTAFLRSTVGTDYAKLYEERTQMQCRHHTISQPKWRGCPTGTDFSIILPAIHLSLCCTTCTSSWQQNCCDQICICRDFSKDEEKWLRSRTSSTPLMNHIITLHISTPLICTHATVTEWCVLARRTPQSTLFPSCPSSSSDYPPDDDPPTFIFKDKPCAPFVIFSPHASIIYIWLTPDEITRGWHPLQRRNSAFQGTGWFHLQIWLLLQAEPHDLLRFLHCL